MDIARNTENFDYDAYFRAFAYFFSESIPSANLSPESAHNIHPYCYLRINFAVQHFEEFYKTYPFRRFPASCTLVQILCDIYSSILYVINLHCHLP